VESLLVIRNLTVFFENALALNNVSMEVYENEIVGVLGSNNAGKTTLMNSVSGLIVDLKRKEARKGGVRITLLGEINYKGENILNFEAYHRAKRGISISRERHPIFRDSSVLENLKIAGFLRHRREMKKDIERIFRIFPPLNTLRSRKAGFLSGGEQQMLSIGVALMVNPQLLLMDEPLLGLSPARQADLVRAVKDIQEEGTTILVTEQFARPLLPILNRGYVMETGIIILSGTGQELIDNPEVRTAYFGV
jgi:branched-chain amino acid transport system ATP-binding protein